MRGAVSAIMQKWSIAYTPPPLSCSVLLLVSTLVQAGRQTCCTLRSPAPALWCWCWCLCGEAWHKANRIIHGRVRETTLGFLAALGLICTAHKAKTSHCPNQSWSVMDRGSACIVLLYVCNKPHLLPALNDSSNCTQNASSYRNAAD